MHERSAGTFSRLCLEVSLLNNSVVCPHDTFVQHNVLMLPSTIITCLVSFGIRFITFGVPSSG